MCKIYNINNKIVHVENCLYFGGYIWSRWVPNTGNYWDYSPFSVRQLVYILADDTVQAAPTVENVTRDLAGREGWVLGESVLCLCLSLSGDSIWGPCGSNSPACCILPASCNMCSQEEILHGTRTENGLDGGWGEIRGFPVVAGDAGFNF
jgi:hypothetical protein